MTPIEGIQPGASVAAARPESERQTPSGARYLRRGRHAPRTWSWELKPWSTPDEVRVLKAAADGSLGDLWLFNAAAARANILHPHQTHGTAAQGYSRVDCDGLALRSLTPGSANLVETVPVGDRASVDSANPYINLGGVSHVSATRRALMRFTLPSVPGTLVSSRLVYERTGSGTVTVTGGAIRRTVGMWSPDTVTYATGPSLGATIGTPPSSQSTGVTIETTLSLTTADLGTTVELAYVASSVSGATFLGFGPARIELTYVPAVGDPVTIRVPVRGGVAHAIACHTTTASGTVLSWSGAATGSLSGVAGGGRRVATFTPAADGILAVTVPAQTGLLSGLQLTEGAGPGVFLPGEGAWASVRVRDLAETMQLALAGEMALADRGVEIVEVGTPGWVPA